MDAGMGRSSALHSMVLTQKPVIQALIPTQCGTRVFVLHFGAYLLDPFGGVGLDHAGLIAQHQAGGRGLPQTTSARGLSFFGQQFGGDDARGIAYDFDIDVRMRFFEQGQVARNLIIFQGRVNQQVLGIHPRRSDEQGQSKQQQTEGAEKTVSWVHRWFSLFFG